MGFGSSMNCTITYLIYKYQAGCKEKIVALIEVMSGRK